MAKSKGFKRLIKDFDIFGYPVHLNFDKKSGGGVNGTFMASPTHQTCLGGLLSLTFYVFVIVILVQLLDMEGSGYVI